MKIQLIKATKKDGTIFYRLENDGHYVPSSLMYGGNIYDSSKDDLNKHYEIAYETFYRYLNSNDEKEELICETIL